MPSAFPILLLGGAAVMIMAGGKKKKKAPIGAGYTKPPPKVKTAGPSGGTAGKKLWKARQTALKHLAEVGVCAACHPGTIDGLYGNNTKMAIMAFQTFARIDIDGKWGSQTEGAMKQVMIDLEKAAKAKPSAPAPAAGGIPTIGPREVGFAPDYSAYKIGNTWKINVLDRFLEDQRRAGKLVTKDTGTSVAEFLYHNPISFLTDITGSEKVAVGVYFSLFAIATAGAGAGIAVAAGAISIDVLAAGAGTMGMSALGLELSFYPLWAENEDMAASALYVYERFVNTKFVKVGDQRVKIVDLPYYEVPAVEKFNKYIMNYIYAFQKRHFEG